jgi:hypothetical protein
VRDRHEGRQTHYSARPAALAPLLDWTSEMTGFWQDRFDDLEDLLRRMDQWAVSFVNRTAGSPSPSC